MISKQIPQYEEKIKHLILNGNFSEAKKLAYFINYEVLRDILFSIAYDYESICSYVFVFVLLSDKETLQYHGLAQELLDYPLCHIKGSYKTSMYHARRSIELDPNDIILKEELLFFNDIPCKPLKDKEARQIALEVLKVKKNSEIAADVLKKLEKIKQE